MWSGHVIFIYLGMYKYVYLYIYFHIHLYVLGKEKEAMILRKSMGSPSEGLEGRKGRRNDAIKL